jgi:hypothetical protein
LCFDIVDCFSNCSQSYEKYCMVLVHKGSLFHSWDCRTRVQLVKNSSLSKHLILHFYLTNQIICICAPILINSMFFFPELEFIQRTVYFVSDSLHFIIKISESGLNKCRKLRATFTIKISLSSFKPRQSHLAVITRWSIKMQTTWLCGACFIPLPCLIPFYPH